MRKILSAILLLLVFLTLQYGRVATYLYCKWQAEMVQKLKECGCESQLAAIFTDKSTELPGPAAIKEFAFEYMQQFEIVAPVRDTNTAAPIADRHSFHLTDADIDPALRPPIA